MNPEEEKLQKELEVGESAVSEERSVEEMLLNQMPEELRGNFENFSIEKLEAALKKREAILEKWRERVAQMKEERAEL